MTSIPVQAYAILRETLTNYVARETDPTTLAEIARKRAEEVEAGKILYAEYTKSHFKIEWLVKKKVKLALNSLKGGRAARRPSHHVMYHRRIKEEYFGYDSFTKDGIPYKKQLPLYTDKKFHRRFRMSAKTLERIYRDIISDDKGNPDFMKGKDVCKVQGATALQKLVSSIRQLAYGNTADIAEEYTGVAENTGRLMLLSFCSWLDVVYGPTYLGAWTVEAVRKEIAINAKRGFSGMLGSVDCTHWGWKACPISMQGQYHDRTGIRSVIAEGVAGHDMYFWHVDLGFPGAINDCAVLGRSTLTMQYMESPARTEEFWIGDMKFTGAFFLADGIYPKYAFLMSSIKSPLTDEQKHFAKCQEACRKDVERAFGRMLSKWHILDCGARMWLLEHVKIVWRACFILHNMTLRDDQDDKSEEPYNSQVEAQRSRELRAENRRVREARVLSGVRREDERRVLAEGGEGQEARSARSDRLRIRRERMARKREEFMLARSNIRRAAKAAGVPPPVRSFSRGRGTLSERCDKADEAHDRRGRGVDMSIPRSDWAMVMRALNHMRCHETNVLLRNKTMAALWAKKGGSVSLPSVAE